MSIEYKKVEYPAELRKKLNEYLNQRVNVNKLKLQINAYAERIKSISEHGFLDNSDLCFIGEANAEIEKLSESYRNSSTFREQNEIVNVTTADIVKELKAFYKGKYIYVPIFNSKHHSGFFYKIDNVFESQGYTNPMIKGEGHMFYRADNVSYLDITNHKQYSFQFCEKGSFKISLNPLDTEVYELSKEQFEAKLNELAQEAVKVMLK